MSKSNFKIKNIFQSSILILIIGVFLKVSQALAQDNSKLATQNFKETADNIVNNVLTSAGTLLITAAFIVFFYGVVVFIYGRVTGKGDMNDLKKGREFMMWGLIALFIMVSVWGIIKLAQGVLDIKGSNIEIQPISFSEIKGSYGGDKDKLPDTNPFQPTANPNNPLQTDSGGVQRENPFANTTIYPVIKVGYNNTIYLEKLFQALDKHKCVDGMNTLGNTYGNDDAEWVKAFQKANGLTIDGTVGKDTWEALSVTTGMKTTFTDITVKDCQ